MFQFLSERSIAIMRHSENRIDYLNDSPAKILFGICFPLIIVNLLLILTTTLTNELYSKFVGPVAFSVTGYLSAITNTFSGIISSIVTAAWIKTAFYYSQADLSSAEQQFVHGVTAITLLELACALPLLLCTDLILASLSIPESIYIYTKLYYILYILCYLPVPIAALFLTIVNGTSSSQRLFWINIAVVFSNAAAAVLLLVVFRTGIIGVALSPVLGAIMQLVMYFVLFRKDGFRFQLRKALSQIDWKQIGHIIRYGLLIALQSLLCTSGYLIVSFQANRILSLEYISVLNVSLPLTGIMTAVSSACIAFCPQNYAAGKGQRLKQFFTLATTCCVLYGLLCFVLYASLGNWYYGRLFRDQQIISYGTEFWFWQGFGQVFLALIFTIRYFFDAVGLGKLSLLSGVGELLGNLVSAFLLIPRFGNIGRSISYPLGWFLAVLSLSIAYLYSRKKIYGPAVKKA